jgi:hypothetical protein
MKFPLSYRVSWHYFSLPMTITAMVACEPSSFIVYPSLRSYCLLLPTFTTLLYCAMPLRRCHNNCFFMYCLSIIVTDYPAKLSNSALPSQQVSMRAGFHTRSMPISETPAGRTTTHRGCAIHGSPCAPHALLRLRYLQRNLHMRAFRYAGSHTAAHRSLRAMLQRPELGCSLEGVRVSVSLCVPGFCDVL